MEDLLVSYAGPTVTFLPAEVARQRGFLREQNLDIKLLLTRSEVDRAALVSGGVDYTLRAGSSFVSAARGLPVRIVFLGTMRPFWGLVVRPEVNSVRELKGKSVGVPGFLGSQHVSAKFILKHHGLDPDKDVVYRVVDTGARIGAVLSGSIDSSMMDYGEAFRAKKAGLKLIVNAAELHGLLAGGLAVNMKKLKEQPDQVRRMLKAMTQALRYMQENPEGTQQVMMNWLKLDREMAADIYQIGGQQLHEERHGGRVHAEFTGHDDAGRGGYQERRAVSARGFYVATASAQVRATRRTRRGGAAMKEMIRNRID